MAYVLEFIRSINYRLRQTLWPGYVPPKLIYKALVEAASTDGFCILHAGGGRNKHGLCAGMHVKRINVDLDPVTLAQDGAASLRILADLEQLPLQDNSIDLVVCEMVFEHLAAPARVLSQLFRCLKENGKIVFITPNLWSYPFLIARLTPFWFHSWYGVWRGRKGDDIFPTHYRLNTSTAILREFARTGFDKVELRQVDSSCDYLDIVPLLYPVGVGYSWLLNRVAALHFLRQFHIGTFQKPRTGLTQRSGLRAEGAEI